MLMLGRTSQKPTDAIKRFDSCYQLWFIRQLSVVSPFSPMGESWSAVAAAIGVQWRVTHGMRVGESKASQSAGTDFPLGNGVLVIVIGLLP